MKLSIIIPAHNEEMLLGQCLVSLHHAIHAAGLDTSQYEVIVVNNGSTDSTPQIASQHGARVIEEPTKGITRARQAGFQMSRGELIAHIDADTEVPVQWIRYALSELARRPDLLALTGPVVYHDLPLHARALVHFFYLFAHLFHLLHHSILGVGATLQGGNCVIRRSALERIGGYDTSIEFYGEDTDMARRIGEIGRIRWTWSFFLYTSGRRIAKEGMFMTGVRYGLNYFAIIYAKRPLNRAYRDIR
jgi:glycosyltransferase involved in cell wall biosynthesis